MDYCSSVDFIFSLSKRKREKNVRAHELKARYRYLLGMHYYLHQMLMKFLYEYESM